MSRSSDGGVLFRSGKLTDPTESVSEEIPKYPPPSIRKDGTSFGKLPKFHRGQIKRNILKSFQSLNNIYEVLKNPKEPVSEKIPKCPPPPIGNDGTGNSRKLSEFLAQRILVKGFLQNLNKIAGNWFRLILLLSMSVDPLFFYIPVVNDDRKCIRWDRKLGITACYLHLLFDFCYTVCIALQTNADFVDSIRGGKDSRKRGRKYVLPVSLIDLFAIFPFPQLIVLCYAPIIRGLKVLDAMKLLKYYVLIPIVPKISRIYTGTSGKLADATPTRATWAFGIFLYVIAGHVLGALWYFLAIERQTECWEQACIDHAGCNRDSFYCDGSLGDYKFLNEFCPTKIRNSTIHDFGIFQDALQSGILEVTDFSQKFLHCFRWGIANLSYFGQNLQTSSNAWENFFVILITISGCLLVLSVLGNLQIYLQHETKRSKEISLKMKEMNELMPIEKLSDNLQLELKKYQQYIWRKTNCIDLENLLSDLPKELGRNIKRELGLELLKKVEEFRKLKEVTLHALCDCVKPIFYSEDSHIVWAGDPIYEMLFIVQGELQLYSIKERTTVSASTLYRREKGNNISRKDYLVDGDFWGEELVTWALHDCSLSNIPISTTTVRACTNVTAFALMAEDLKNLFIER